MHNWSEGLKRQWWESALRLSVETLVLYRISYTFIIGGSFKKILASLEREPISRSTSDKRCLAVANTFLLKIVSKKNLFFASSYNIHTYISSIFMELTFVFLQKSLVAACCQCFAQKCLNCSGASKQQHYNSHPWKYSYVHLYVLVGIRL